MPGQKKSGLRNQTSPFFMRSNPRRHSVSTGPELHHVCMGPDSSTHEERLSVPFTAASQCRALFDGKIFQYFKYKKILPEHTKTVVKTGMRCIVFACERLPSRIAMFAATHARTSNIIVAFIFECCQEWVLVNYKSHRIIGLLQSLSAEKTEILKIINGNVFRSLCWLI